MARREDLKFEWPSLEHFDHFSTSEEDRIVCEKGRAYAEEHIKDHFDNYEHLALEAYVDRPTRRTKESVIVNGHVFEVTFSCTLHITSDRVEQNNFTREVTRRRMEQDREYWAKADAKADESAS